MPLFSIPVHRFQPHDLVYWSGAASFDEVYILSRTSGATTTAANDRAGDVILNQGGAGTRFRIPSNGAEAFCRTLESNLSSAEIIGGSNPTISNTLRLVAGVVRTDGGAAKTLVMGRSLTVGESTGDATLSFVNDAPGSGIFTVDMRFVGLVRPAIIDKPDGVVSVEIGDGVHLRTENTSALGVNYTGGTIIDTGGKWSLTQRASATIASVDIEGEFHVAAPADYQGANPQKVIRLAASVATSGAGKLTVEGGRVENISLGSVRSLVYLESGCSVAMDEIAGVLGGTGTILGPVVVAANGYLLAGTGTGGDASAAIAVTGDLEIDGGSLFLTAVAFSSSTGKHTGLGVINCSGAFTATSVAAVRISGTLAAGTYTIITATSITGTLPDPPEITNFANYNYNATDIEIVLV